MGAYLQPAPREALAKLWLRQGRVDHSYVIELLVSGVIDALILIGMEMAGVRWVPRPRRFVIPDSVVIASAAAIVIGGLVLVRGLDVFGIAALMVIAVITGWAVSKFRR